MPDSEPITQREIAWQEYHPARVNIIASKADKRESESILLVRGKNISPKEAFDLAKNHGDHDAALAYAKHMIDANSESITTLISQNSGKKPILLPVVALERSTDGVHRYNAIPDAFAAVISEKTGWPIQGDNGEELITQVNKAGRTGASPVERMVRQASFAGAVKPSENYILLDDHFTNGGTFRNLLEHVEQGGGKIVDVTTLINGRRDDMFKATNKSYSRATQVFGKNEFSVLHEKMFGTPCTNASELKLTAGEVSQMLIVAKDIENKIIRGYDDHARTTSGKEKAPNGKQLQGLVYKEFDSQISEAAAKRATEIQSRNGGQVDSSGINGVRRSEPTSAGEVSQIAERRQGNESLEISPLPIAQEQRRNQALQQQEFIEQQAAQRGLIAHEQQSPQQQQGMAKDNIFAAKAAELNLRPVELSMGSVVMDGAEWVHLRNYQESQPEDYKPFPTREDDPERLSKVGKMWGWPNGLLEYVDHEGYFRTARHIPQNIEALTAAGYVHTHSDKTFFLKNGAVPRGDVGERFSGMWSTPVNEEERLEWGVKFLRLNDINTALDNGVDPYNRIVNDGNPILHRVMPLVRDPMHDEVVRRLIKIEPQARDKEGGNALHWAQNTSYDTTPVIPDILAAGVSAFELNNDGRPPFLSVYSNPSTTNHDVHKLIAQAAVDTPGLTPKDKKLVEAQTKIIASALPEVWPEDPTRIKKINMFGQIWEWSHRNFTNVTPHELIPSNVQVLLEPLTDPKRVEKFTETLSNYKMDGLDGVNDMVTEFTNHVALPQALIEYSKKTGQPLTDDFLAQLDPAELKNAMKPAVREELLGSRSLDKIIGLNEAWHDERVFFPDNLKPLMAFGEWHSLTEGTVHHYPDSDLSLHVLTDHKQLEAEGSIMRHCVGRGEYTTKCLNADSHIISIRQAGQDSPISTFEGRWDAEKKTLVIKQNQAPGNTIPPKEAQDAAGWFKGQVESGAIKINEKLGETAESKASKTRPDVIGRGAGFEITQENVNAAYSEFAHNNKRRGREYNLETGKFDTISRNIDLLSGSANIVVLGSDGKPELTTKGKPKVVGVGYRDMTADQWAKDTELDSQFADIVSNHVAIRIPSLVQPVITREELPRRSLQEQQQREQEQLQQQFAKQETEQRGLLAFEQQSQQQQAGRSKLSVFEKKAAELNLKPADMPFASVVVDGVKWSGGGFDSELADHEKIFPTAVSDKDRINLVGKMWHDGNILEFVDNEGKYHLARKIDANTEALKAAGYDDSEYRRTFFGGRLPEGEVGEDFIKVMRTPKDENERLSRAAQSGNLAEFNYALAHGADPHLPLIDRHDRPLLQQAIGEPSPGRDQIIRQLLKIDPTVKSPNGETPLHWALGNYQPAISYLPDMVEAGMSPLARDNSGTPAFLELHNGVQGLRTDFNYLGKVAVETPGLDKKGKLIIEAQYKAIQDVLAAPLESERNEIAYKFKRVWQLANCLPGKGTEADLVPPAVRTLFEPVTDPKRSAKFMQTINNSRSDNLQNINDMLGEFTDHVVLPQALIEHSKKTGQPLTDEFLKALDHEKLKKKLLPEVRSELLKGRSLDKIIGLNEAWHDSQVIFPDTLKPIKASGEWHPITEQTTHSVPGTDLTLHILTDHGQLEREGKTMDHCVGRGGYTTKCLDADSHIISVRKDGVALPLSTIEGAWDGKEFKIRQNHAPGNTKPPQECEQAADWFKNQIETKALPVNKELGETAGSKALKTRPRILGAVGYELKQDNVNAAYNEFCHNNKRRGREYNPDTGKFDIISRNVELIAGSHNQVVTDSAGNPQLSEKGKPKIESIGYRDMPADQWLKASGLHEKTADIVTEHVAQRQPKTDQTKSPTERHQSTTVPHEGLTYTSAGMNAAGMLAGANRYANADNNAERAMGAFEMTASATTVALEAGGKLKGAGIVGTTVATVDGVYETWKAGKQAYDRGEIASSIALTVADKGTEVGLSTAANIFTVGMAGGATNVLYDRAKENAKETAALEAKAYEMATGKRKIDVKELANDYIDTKKKDAIAAGHAVLQSTPGKLVTDLKDIGVDQYDIIKTNHDLNNMYKPQINEAQAQDPASGKPKMGGYANLRVGITFQGAKDLSADPELAKMGIKNYEDPKWLRENLNKRADELQKAQDK